MNDANFGTPLRTIEQARDFFREMGCSHFHMAREYPERYQEYQHLQISEQLETEWRKERFQEYFADITGLTNTPSTLWQIYSSMYDLYENLKTEEELSQLLEVTYRIQDKVPPDQRVIVAETINGRTSQPGRSGLIYLSYDMGNVTTAREFLELSLRFSEYQDNDMDETALAQLYSAIPLQFLRHKDYTSHHRERCQKTTNRCLEIRNELGL